MAARKLKAEPLATPAMPAAAPPAPAAPQALAPDGLERRSRHGKRLSVIAPAYNEEDVLAFFFLRMERVLNACAVDWEIICVNDGAATPPSRCCCTSISAIRASR